MKKRLKLFFLVMMTIILTNFQVSESNAKVNYRYYDETGTYITDIGKNPYIPDVLEIPVITNENYFDENKTYDVGREIIEKKDEGKVQKIIIPEYSYVYFFCNGGDFSLYENSNKTNKILLKKNGIDNSDYSFSADAFLPKGEYYICVDNLGDKKNTFHLGILRYFRTPVKDMMNGIIKKGNKYYSYNSMGRYKCRWISESPKSYSDDIEYSFYYNDVYEYEYVNDHYFTTDKDCYKRIKFNIFVKNKNSNPVITPTGLTKDILEAESNGGTYDSSKSSKKKDTKKPTVKGVKNNKTYKKSVKFKVSDKSGIKKVTLNKKKIKVSKAKKGYTVKNNGKYTLKVWDKAGNVRTVKFKIKK